MWVRNGVVQPPSSLVVACCIHWWLFGCSFELQNTKFEANQTVDIRLVYEVMHDSHVRAVGGNGGLRVELMENKQSS